MLLPTAFLGIFQPRYRPQRAKPMPLFLGLRRGNIWVKQSKTMKVQSSIKSLPIAAIASTLQNTINSLLSLSSEAPGPFWCASPEATYLYIPQNRPHQPFQTGQGFSIQPLRFTDQRARSGTPFRLFGTASLGSQSERGARPSGYGERREAAPGASLQLRVYSETPYFFRLHDLCICDPAGVRRGGCALFVEILGDAG